MQKQTRWRAFIWYKHGTHRQRVVFLDWWTFEGAELWIKDMCHYWPGWRDANILPTIVEWETWV